MFRIILFLLAEILHPIYEFGEGDPVLQLLDGDLQMRS